MPTVKVALAQTYANGNDRIWVQWIPTLPARSCVGPAFMQDIVMQCQRERAPHNSTEDNCCLHPGDER